MDQDELDVLTEGVAAIMRRKDEEWLRGYLADMQEKVEEEQQRLQHMTDVGFHERDVERRRQRVVEREAEKARLQASRATAEQLSECDKDNHCARVLYRRAKRDLVRLLRDPAAYARFMTPETHRSIAELQHYVSFIEARLEEMEQQRLAQELEKRRQKRVQSRKSHAISDR
jgi:HPt (histidine-containing phosphotransfer) domain-containing protein